MEQSFVGKEPLPVMKRCFANIIDIIVGVICAFLVMIIVGAKFPEVTDTAYFIGSLNKGASDYLHADFIDSVAAIRGEFWTVLIFVPVHSLIQLICERKWSATLGTKLMNGICVGNRDSLFTKLDANTKFFTRNYYYLGVFFVCYHLFDIRPIYIIFIMWGLSLYFCLKHERNVIETLLKTRTIKREPSAKSNTNITERNF